MLDNQKSDNGHFGDSPCLHNREQQETHVLSGRFITHGLTIAQVAEWPRRHQTSDNIDINQ